MPKDEKDDDKNEDELKAAESYTLDFDEAAFWADNSSCTDICTNYCVSTNYGGVYGQYGVAATNYGYGAATNYGYGVATNYGYGAATNYGYGQYGVAGSPENYGYGVATNYGRFRRRTSDRDA